MEAKKNTNKPVTMYRYVGRGDYLIGLPARDLTPDEWAELPEGLREKALILGTHLEEYVPEREE